MNANSTKSHPLELLKSRTLICLIKYLDFSNTEEANDSLVRVLKDYRDHKDEVKSALRASLQFLVKDRYIPDYSYGFEVVCKKEIDPVQLAITKRCVNEMIKKVWKQ